MMVTGGGWSQYQLTLSEVSSLSQRQTTIHSYIYRCNAMTYVPIKFFWLQFQSDCFNIGYLPMQSLIQFSKINFTEVICLYLQIITQGISLKLALTKMSIVHNSCSFYTTEYVIVRTLYLAFPSLAELKKFYMCPSVITSVIQVVKNNTNLWLTGSV